MAAITVESVKVKYLREKYADVDMDLERWFAMPNHVYTGRPGRVFIGTGADKHVFHYPGSKWANPYPVKEGTYTLGESLSLYITHLFESGLIASLGELDGQTLGCFCTPAAQKNDWCHASILQRLATTYKDSVTEYLATQDDEIIYNLRTDLGFPSDADLDAGDLIYS